MQAANLRTTASRLGILDALVSARRPLTMPEILEHRPGLSQSSTYRNLGELIGARVVARIDTGDGHARFELADDLTEHHHHLVCTGCGDVRDVELGPDVEDAVEEAARRLESSSGARVTGHRLDLVGLCARCR